MNSLDVDSLFNNISPDKTIDNYVKELFQNPDISVKAYLKIIPVIY